MCTYGELVNSHINVYVNLNINAFEFHQIFSTNLNKPVIIHFNTRQIPSEILGKLIFNLGFERTLNFLEIKFCHCNLQLHYIWVKMFFFFCLFVCEEATLLHFIIIIICITITGQVILQFCNIICP